MKGQYMEAGLGSEMNNNAEQLNMYGAGELA